MRCPKCNWILVLKESEGGQKTWYCMNDNCEESMFKKDTFKLIIVGVVMLFTLASCGTDNGGMVKIDGKYYKPGARYFRNIGGSESLIK